MKKVNLKLTLTLCLLLNITQAFADNYGKADYEAICLEKPIYAVNTDAAIDSYNKVKTQLNFFFIDYLNDFKTFDNIGNIEAQEQNRNGKVADFCYTISNLKSYSIEQDSKKEQGRSLNCEIMINNSKINVGNFIFKRFLNEMDNKCQEAFPVADFPEDL